MAFNTRNELLNAITLVSFNLVFLDPDGAIGQPDMLDHDILYMGFDLEQSVDTGSFASKMVLFFDDEEV